MIAASATRGPPQRASRERVSDLGLGSAGELGNVPGGHVLEQLERVGQWPGVVFAVAGEEEDLRVHLLQRPLELLVVSYLDHAVEAELERGAVGALQLRLVVVETRQGKHAGVGPGRA